MSYFAAHTERLTTHRLYTGQSIGSGMVRGRPKLSRQTAKANRGPLARRQRQRHGPTVLSNVSRSWSGPSGVQAAVQ